MPELPEVETIRKDLERKLPSKVIKDVKVGKERMVKGKTPQEFKNALIDKSIRSLKRKGKLLMIELSDGSFLLIHLKMSGQLIYKDRKELIAGGHSLKEHGSLSEAIGGMPPNKYTHIIFEFLDGSFLYFNDMRQFGYVKLADKKETEGIEREQGADPLSDRFTAEYFRKATRKRKAAVKQVLMDQSVIAGIGNIYADEILFEAGVRPDRPATEIKKEEAQKIVKATQKILKQAVRHRGTTFSDYTDAQGDKGNYSSYLKIYGRKEGEKCYKCGGSIRVIKVNNRGTRYCPKCQK
ncbi:MAG: bifunctional DNA-formamidopyrimidine glycosylase/DNA-(apurinic or apyrimidinic site) lyase [Patescibacteria group bacterium]